MAPSLKLDLTNLTYFYSLPPNLTKIPTFWVT